MSYLHHSYPFEDDFYDEIDDPEFDGVIEDIAVDEYEMVPFLNFLSIFS